MLELMQTLRNWQPILQHREIAVATITDTRGSVPRPVGTSMLIGRLAGRDTPSILGSLSGGCVEGAVVAAALDALDEDSARIETFRFSMDDALAVGLTCGGELEVHIQPMAPSAAIQLAKADPEPFAIIHCIGSGAERLKSSGQCPLILHSPPTGAELSTRLRATFPGDNGEAGNAASLVESVLARGLTAVVPVRGGQECQDGLSLAPVRLLVESRLPAPRLLVIGANDFSEALIPAARLLSYHVTLIDARPAFARQDRFAAADEIAVEWPHEYLASEAAAGRLDDRTVVCVLSHDPKFDIPLLDTALHLDLGYLGAMGSRRSHEQRITSLLESGHGPLDLAKMHSPIGLDLGAVTPSEVAISILAEVVASKAHAATGSPLREGSGPIHALSG